MKTKTLLDATNVTVYDHDYKTSKHGPRDRYFATPGDAAKWIAQAGVRVFSVYRIEKVNGTWRTDWVLDN